MRNALPDRVRIGVFELDLRGGELRDGERSVWLQEQPLSVLRMLVERDGETVTRDELKQKLWPNDTIVDFDHSINTAIRKLRQALGDSADEPKYVATVARRGYRLLMPVERVSADDSSGAFPTLSPKPGEKGGAPPPTGSVPVETDSLIGKKVSHYRVLGIIGGGGMGLVYEAEDLKLGRRVALKFLPEELAGDAVALQRFEREAQTASSLNHPNICTIHEVEEHESQPFIVMELLVGETLRDRLASQTENRQALPLEQLLDIGIQVCDGLQAAHEKGIIHRDIKPANIFITSKRVVKILDFGLAKLVVEAPEVVRVERRFSPASGDPSPSVMLSDEVVSRRETTEESKDPYNHDDLAAIGVPRLAAQTPGRSLGMTHEKNAPDATLTRTGQAMGTAGYMSPEQVRGEKLDARTDIFSFGLVLYEMATGQRAFTGETAAVVYEAILNNSPVPVRELNSTLPAKLVTTIDKALEKDRKRRCQSARELRAELESCDSSRQLVMRSPEVQGEIPGTPHYGQVTPQPGRRFVEKFEGEASRIRSLAVLPLQNLSGDPEQEYFADGLTEALIISLSKIRALRVVSRTTAMSYKGVLRSVPQIGQELGVDAVVEGTVLRSGERVRLTAQLVDASSDMHLWAESYERNLRDVLSLQAELTQAVANEIQIQLSPKEKALFRNVHPVDPEAYESYLRGRYYLSKRDGEMPMKGIQAFQLAITKDPSYAAPYAGLAECLCNLGLWAFVSPEDGCGRAKQLALKALELAPGLAEAHASLGFSLQHYDYDVASAATELRRAIELNPLYEIGHIWLASNHLAMGHFEEAIAEANHAVRLDPLARAAHNILVEAGPISQVPKDGTPGSRTPRDPGHPLVDDRKKEWS